MRPPRDCDHREPHLRPEGDKDVLRPRLEALAEKLCQTQAFIIGALRDVGLTVVPLTVVAATDPTCEHGDIPGDCYRCYQLDVLAESRR